MSYFVNPLRLNYSEDKFVLHKVIVFLSRSPMGENVLILFPIKLKNCTVHPLIKSFTEFVSIHENRGKKYQIINNDEVIETEDEINQYDNVPTSSYCNEYKQFILLNNTCKYMVKSLKELYENRYVEDDVK